MKDRFQLLIDGKSVGDFTIFDLLALAGICRPRELYEDRPISVECGRFELQRYERQ